MQVDREILMDSSFMVIDRLQTIAFIVKELTNLFIDTLMIVSFKVSKHLLFLLTLLNTHLYSKLNLIILDSLIFTILLYLLITAN